VELGTHSHLRCHSLVIKVAGNLIWAPEIPVGEICCCDWDISAITENAKADVISATWNAGATLIFALSTGLSMT
jgi:hypothetical protein